MRWFLWRWRFVISSVAIAVAVAITAAELRPASEATQTVVVVRTAVSAGHTIDAADVHLADVPASVVPADALTRPDDVAGRSAAVQLSEATVVTTNLLAGSDARSLAPPGTVIVPVRLSDATITDFIQVGDHVDLVLVPDNRFDPEDHAGVSEGEITTTVLASRALVLPSPTPEQAASGGLLGGPLQDDDSSSFLLVAVSTKEAQTLTASARSGYIGAVLVE